MIELRCEGLLSPYTARRPRDHAAAGRVSHGPGGSNVSTHWQLEAQRVFVIM